MYLDGSAESGGDLAPVTLDAGPDVARNPYELQLATGVVGAVHAGLCGEGVLFGQRLGGFLRDGQGGHFRELLEGGDGEGAGRPATAGGESRREEDAAGAERRGKARRREAASVEAAMELPCPCPGSSFAWANTGNRGAEERRRPAHRRPRSGTERARKRGGARGDEQIGGEARTTRISRETWERNPRG
jgi:hypothetical protein